MTIWRMRFARWITKAAGIHLEYVTFIDFSTATIVSLTFLDVT